MTLQCFINTEKEIRTHAIELLKSVMPVGPCRMVQLKLQNLRRHKAGDSKNKNASLALYLPANHPNSEKTGDELRQLGLTNHCLTYQQNKLKKEERFKKLHGQQEISCFIKKKPQPEQPENTDQKSKQQEEIAPKEKAEDKEEAVTNPEEA
jgi:hypothetical protein